MKPRSIRARLALGNGLLFILLVGLLSLFLYFSYSHYLRSDLDRLLAEHSILIIQNLAEELEEDSKDPRSLLPFNPDVESDAAGKSEELSILAEFTAGEGLAQLVDASGRVLDASPVALRTAALVDQSVIQRALLAEKPFFVTTETDRRGQSRLLVRSVAWRENDPEAVLLVGQPLSRIREAVSRLRRQLLAGAPLMVLLAMAAGYLVAYWNLRPVGRMIQGVRNIDGQGLDRRLEIQNPADELGRLASTFNEFLDRLQRAFESEQRFVADASHELRTPLSIIRGEIEVTLARRRSPIEYEAALKVVHSEVLRLNRLADSLLLLARAQTERESFPKARIDFGELISAVCSKLRPSARAKSIRLECICAEEELVLQGEAESLEQMAHNLIENAIFYSHERGNVMVTVSSEPESIRFVVEDQGVGIPASDLHRIFDRFYRADSARSDSQGHVGLGLALVNLIVELHGGKIDVESKLDEGTRFTVSLPCSSE